MNVKLEVVAIAVKKKKTNPEKYTVYRLERKK